MERLYIGPELGPEDTELKDAVDRLFPDQRFRLALARDNDGMAMAVGGGWILARFGVGSWGAKAGFVQRNGETPDECVAAVKAALEVQS